MEVKDKFLSRWKFKINSDKQKKILGGWWLGNKALMDEFSTLYGIGRKNNMSVSSTRYIDRRHLMFPLDSFSWWKIESMFQTNSYGSTDIS